MDLLVVLSTSTSYFASVAMMAVDVEAGRGAESHMSYFDSSTFLIMFILGGRALEAYAKSKVSTVPHDCRMSRLADAH
jgi:cation transport ATPase